MTIELSREAKLQAVESIQRYSREFMDEPMGNVPAGALLAYFLEEIGPLVYNQGVADVQERLQARVSEVDIEVHEEPFGFWKKHEKVKRPR